MVPIPRINRMPSLYPLAGRGFLLLLIMPLHARASFENVHEQALTLLGLFVLVILLFIGALILYRHHRRTLEKYRLAKEAVEQNYTLLNAVFNHSPIGMMVQDRSRHIIRSNAALEAILGARPEVLDNMGTALSSLITDDKARSTLLHAYKELLVHPSHMLKVKLPIRTLHGRDKWVLVSAQTLVSDGVIDGLLWQVQDITREENALRELQRVSSMDPLTGLLNRRAFMQLWSRERARAMRQGSPLSLVIMDLDFFKQINDCFGHQAGDEVLVHVACILQDQTRDTDIIARFGGEEFVMLLPDTDLDGARDTAEKVRQTLAATPARLSDQRQVAVTLSAGAAQWKAGEPFEALYKKADAALYQAKHQGRNRVEVWGSNTARLRES